MTNPRPAAPRTPFLSYYLRVGGKVVARTKKGGPFDHGNSEGEAALVKELWHGIRAGTPFTIDLEGFTVIRGVVGTGWAPVKSDT